MIPHLLLGSNPFFEAYAQSDLFGKGIFITLFFLSILSWVIIVQKTMSYRTMRRLAFQFEEAFAKKKDFPLHVEPSSRDNPFVEIYRVLKGQTLELLNKNKQGQEEGKVFLSSPDIDLVASHICSTVAMQVKNLEGNLFILSTIATLAPFLGLLGTVWGILITFSELNSRAAGQSNEVMLGGLAMALGTTIVGLIVAIPALIAYNFLKNRAREFQTEMEDFSTFALASVEIQYRKA